MSPAKPTPDTVIDGRYQLVAPLDDWGLGECWVALDGADGARVAVKLLPAVPPSDKDTGPAFQALARRLSKLQHPAVAATRAHGFWQGRPYLVTEHIPAVSLQRGITQARDAKHLLDRGVLANLLDRACEGVAAAHAQERPLVHGGLTPASIVAARVGDRFELRVLDFGLASLFGPRLVNDRSGEYTAPEVEDDPGRASPAADVFALGAMVIEVITDRRTVSGGGGATIGGLSAVAKLRDDLPAALMGVASRATKLDPDARFDSVTALQDALAAAWSPPDRPAPAKETSRPEPAVVEGDVAVQSWVRFSDHGAPPAPLVLPPLPRFAPTVPMEALPHVPSAPDLPQTMVAARPRERAQPSGTPPVVAQLGHDEAATIVTRRSDTPTARPPPPAAAMTAPTPARVPVTAPAERSKTGLIVLGVVALLGLGAAGAWLVHTMQH